MVDCIWYVCILFVVSFLPVAFADFLSALDYHGAVVEKRDLFI